MTGCIVCGVDDSRASRRAASVAARLARDLGEPALLVHVGRTGGVLSGLPRARTRRRLRRAFKALAGELCFPPETDIRVQPGEPDVELMTIARVEDAGLLVVGSRGEHGIPTALLGSVASTLMAAAPCPVIITPPDTIEPLDSESMRGIVCGVAGDETDLTPLRVAADLIGRLGGELHAVHAYDDMAAEPGRSSDEELRGAAERRLALALERAEVEARSNICALPAAEGLARVADRERAGLIVVGAGGGNGSGLHGSTPTRLAFDGRTALLVVPPGVRLEAGSGRYEAVPEAV